MAHWRHAFLLVSLILVLLNGALLTLSALNQNTHLQAGDQGAYLRLSLQQKNLLALTDGNRHPLYPLILTPLAARSTEFFARARWVSVTLAWVLISIILINEYGRPKAMWTALGIASVLCFHTQMSRTASEIWCEPLLYLWVYLIWRKLDNCRGTTAAADLLRAAPALGGLCGLTYLTKGTGSLVLATVLLTVLACGRKWRRLPGALGKLTCCFLLVSAPLLVWNTVVYHQPFYSFASTHNMWFDEPDEIWYNDPADLPTLGSYLREHTCFEIGVRLGGGVLSQLSMVSDLGWQSWTLPEAFPKPYQHGFLAFKSLFLALCLVGMVRLMVRRQPVGEQSTEPEPPTGVCSLPAMVFLVSASAFFVVAFGWYSQLTQAPRFLATLLVPWTVVIARLTAVGATMFSVHPWRLIRGGVLVVQTLLVMALLAITAQTLPSFLASRQMPPPGITPIQQQALMRLEELPENCRIVQGPSHQLPIWLAREDLKWMPTPWNITWDEFEDFLNRTQAGYLLLDHEMTARHMYLKRLLHPEGLPSGWQMSWRNFDSQGVFLLFKVD